ncbi:hypothetical protein FRC18_005519 [Serendipita sp. 400]|nr:hypothetical protein FRC18_005519 [Serendipita sp. 400]
MRKRTPITSPAFGPDPLGWPPPPVGLVVGPEGVTLVSSGPYPPPPMPPYVVNVVEVLAVVLVKGETASTLAWDGLQLVPVGITVAQAGISKESNPSRPSAC